MVANLYEQALLGHAMPRRGKGVVLRILGEGCSRDTGTAEWGNALALFINVGGKRFNNEFYDGGREVTWFASRRQCTEGLLSKIIARLLRQDQEQASATAPTDQLEDPAGTPNDRASSLLSAGTRTAYEVPVSPPGAAAVDATASDGETSVLLFCRTQEQPYVFLGRLNLVRVDLRVAPAMLVWRLEEFDQMNGSLYFQQVLRAAAAPPTS
jgi:hypothetical protein